VHHSHGQGEGTLPHGGQLPHRSHTEAISTSPSHYIIVAESGLGLERDWLTYLRVTWNSINGRGEKERRIDPQANAVLS